MGIDFSRRDFLKKTGLLVGTAGLVSTFPSSIAKAFSIDPDMGSSFEDAEHIVLLMQENRSFDHCFGTLKGVRGFNDPLALRLANANPVWLQTDEKNDTYSPFRLDMERTKITWMGGLPHTWRDQVDARNNGGHDKWLSVKKTSYPDFKGQPLTLGYYTRQDIPFNYAMADAFTVCDQYFCSSLTGTTPNRLYFFSGALRKDGLAQHPALVRNEESDHDKESSWKTLPELLQENNISWKVYQNELSISPDLSDEADAWLSNFTDNPLEWFTQFKVRRSVKYEKALETQLQLLSDQIRELELQVRDHNADRKVQRKLADKTQYKSRLEAELLRCRKELSEPQSAHEKALNENAFVTNDFDPDYRALEEITYNDQGIERKMRVPKSDVLANFRRDVKEKKLPAVSWLVAPQYFSDHPSAPWFGSWYISEVLDILTHDEKIWKKTIFIVTYDENDGYFDHIPPFVAPDYRNPSTGMVSKGITGLDKEFVTLEDEISLKGIPKQKARQGPIGLGYRVPFIVASPWSKGGFVNSQVFDHTSVVQFVEKFASRKTGKSLRLDNVSEWRRAVCGDLSSVFRPYHGEAIKQPDLLNRDLYLQRIDEAQYQPLPRIIKPLTVEEIDAIKDGRMSVNKSYGQEKGGKPSCALPYELYAHAEFDAPGKNIKWTIEASNKVFKDKAMGSAFMLYAYKPYRDTDGRYKVNRNWAFAVVAGEKITYDIPLEDFSGKEYHLALFGPNGFYREVKGDVGTKDLNIQCTYQEGKKAIKLFLTNVSAQKKECIVSDNSYGQHKIRQIIPPLHQAQVILPLDKSYGWYDFSVSISNNSAFEERFAGRIENGKDSFSDPML